MPIELLAVVEKMVQQACKIEEVPLHCTSGRQETMYLGRERFLATEFLWSWPLHHDEKQTDGKGLPDLIERAITSVWAQPGFQPEDDPMKNYVVLEGGTTHLRGFSKRLENELKKRHPHREWKVQEERPYSVWRGAAKMSIHPNFAQKWVSKEEYDESGTKYRAYLLEIELSFAPGPSVIRPRPGY